MGAADERVWCGVDIGTTNVKVLLVAANGTVVARASHPTPRVPDAFGACTDAEQLFDLIEALVLQAYREASLSVPLSALCVGGVGEDGVLLDDALRPLELCIPWNDRRAAEQADALAGSALWRAAQPPVPMEPTRTAAKWAWLRDNRPGIVRAAAVWVALTDYPAVRWTGRAFMSRTLATRTACYDPGAREWLPKLLRDCGAPPLPPVLSGGSEVGIARSTRLREAGTIADDTMVVAGGHDHPMAASLVCGAVEGAILDSMGTAELVYVESRRRGAGDACFTESASILDSRTAWLGVFELSRMLEPMLRATHPLHAPFSAVMAGAMVCGTPGAAGLRFVPGTDSATFAPAAPVQERLRAVLEGGAMLSRTLIERADKLADAAEPGPLYVAGGWARSDTLLQLRADVIGRKLHRIEETQLSALGSAHLAARGSGARLPFNPAARTFEPDRELKAFHDHAYRTRQHG